MSVGLLDELRSQLEGQEVKEVEESTTMLVEKGRYHAVVNGVDEDVTTDNGNRGIELEFSLLGGKKPGKLVSHTLYARGKDAEKTKKMLTQINLFALRLGIATKDGEGRIKFLPGRSFKDTIGTEVIVDVIVGTRTSKNGQPYEANEIKFCGIYALDDPKAREGAHLASEEQRKKAAEKKAQDDLSEIPV